MLKFKVKESDNYIFNYLENSLAEKEIDLIIQEQEQVIKVLQAFFNIKMPFKIQYYLLNTAKQVGHYFGQGSEVNGCAVFPDKVYAVYNEEVRCIGHHEDTHIVTNLIGRPTSFIEEGIAMYFDKTWWGEENEKWVIRYLKDGKYISITELMYDEDKFYLYPEITYPISGAFTKFLIDVFGKEKYMKLYKSKNISKDTFVEIYEITLNQLEESFLQHIKTNVDNKKEQI